MTIVNQIGMVRRAFAKSMGRPSPPTPLPLRRARGAASPPLLPQRETSVAQRAGWSRRSGGGEGQLCKSSGMVGRWTAVALIVALLGLNGCGGEASGPVKTTIQRQAVDHLTIALELPAQPQLLTEQDVVVTLTDADGAAVDGAAVWLGLVMPSHEMSPNEPDAAPAGNGHYRAKALFTMSGAWTVEVHATVQGQEYIATFRTQTL